MRSRVFKLIRKEQWSSAQVSRWLRRAEGWSGSKSAIYNWIAGGSPHYKDSIHKHLRRGGKKSENSAQGSRIPIPNRVSVDERPAEANGQTLGNREMDTIVGKDDKGAIVTLVERKNSFMLMEKLNTGKQAIPPADAVVRLLNGYQLPVRTIATDNGTEFAAHEIIEMELNARVYFAHPYSSWEKGAIENTKGLTRQYIPKKTDFKGITRGYVRMVVDKLNNRPRKKYGFIKPIDMINERIT